jgi:ABC-2 type transport system ATP-binding protein
MTGRQLVRFLSRLRGHPEYAHIDALARRFDIDLDLPLSQLSSGMKRKVALLQVLAPHTPLLILDEPTNTLDPTMRAELLNQLREARHQGNAVLFSSHVLAEVEEVCDRVGILQNGRLVHVQDMRELRDGRRLRIRFAKPPDQLPALPGLQLCERLDGQLILEHTGPLPPLLAWLSSQAVVDLQTEALGLAPIYRKFHGAES